MHFLVPRILTVATLVVAFVFVVATPVAEADDLTAREAWAAGQQRFESKDYRGAMRYFERGYQVSKKGGFLLNAAECARLMGDKATARATYLRYMKAHATGKHFESARASCDALGLGPCTVEHVKNPAKPDASKAAAATVSPTSASNPEPEQPFLPPKEPKPEPESRPFYKHWALWVSVGAVVVAGAVAAVAVSQSGRMSMPEGDLSVDFRRK